MFQILLNTEKKTSLLSHYASSVYNFQSVFVSFTVLANKLLLKKAKQILRLNELAAELSFAQLSPNWRGLWILQIQRGQRVPGLWSVISNPPALDLWIELKAEFPFFISFVVFGLCSVSERDRRISVRTTEEGGFFFFLFNSGLFLWPGKFGRKAKRKNKGASKVAVCAACRRLVTFVW